jgi:hypothetical protein
MCSFLGYVEAQIRCGDVETVYLSSVSRNPTALRGSPATKFDYL